MLAAAPAAARPHRRRRDPPLRPTPARGARQGPRRPGHAGGAGDGATVPLYVTEFGWTTSPPGSAGLRPGRRAAGYIRDARRARPPQLRRGGDPLHVVLAAAEPGLRGAVLRHRRLDGHPRPIPGRSAWDCGAAAGRPRRSCCAVRPLERRLRALGGDAALALALLEREGGPLERGQRRLGEAMAIGIALEAGEVERQVVGPGALIADPRVVVEGGRPSCLRCRPSIGRSREMLRACPSSLTSKG